MSAILNRLFLPSKRAKKGSACWLIKTRPTVRPGKKPANTGVILTNEKTQVSESGKSCREGQEEEDSWSKLWSTFCEKVDGGPVIKSRGGG